MAQQTKCGFVYIISNIGSFGENFIKIGMTRRLEPRDRIKELSNASVPFQYDVHTLIYSENAPKLEFLLHEHFKDFRINLVNNRKEFFRIPIKDVEIELKRLNISTNFILEPEAKQYRESQKILLEIENSSLNKKDSPI